VAQDCVIWDLDGTLFDTTHRQHLLPDWNAFFVACVDDPPIAHVVRIFDLLHKGYDESERLLPVFVSGRSEQVRAQTEASIIKHIYEPADNHTLLFMRAQGDHRPDNQVKSDILDQILHRGLNPIVAFDDRDQVVNMWRSRGIPCFQVAEGKF